MYDRVDIQILLIWVYAGFCDNLMNLGAPLEQLNAFIFLLFEQRHVSLEIYVTFRIHSTDAVYLIFLIVVVELLLGVEIA